MFAWRLQTKTQHRRLSFNSQNRVSMSPCGVRYPPNAGFLAKRRVFVAAAEWYKALGNQEI
jgi:hypothetical protein